MKIGDGGRIPSRDQSGETIGNVTCGVAKVPTARARASLGLLDGLRSTAARAPSRAGMEGIVAVAAEAAELHRLRSASPVRPSAPQRIKEILRHAVRPGATSRVLVVGYAPFPHADAASIDALMEAVSRSLSDGHLAPDSVVVMHVPEHLLQPPRAAAFEALLRALGSHKVHVVAACVDKAVYGDLGSDDAAGQGAPRRVGSVVDCALPDAASLRDGLPVLSSRKLFWTLRSELTDDAMANKVIVLADSQSMALRDALECKAKRQLSVAGGTEPADGRLASLFQP